MVSVGIEGAGTTEFDAEAGNGEVPVGGLAQGLKPLPVCCCWSVFVDAFPLPLLKDGEERTFPKIS